MVFRATIVSGGWVSVVVVGGNGMDEIIRRIRENAAVMRGTLLASSSSPRLLLP